MEALLFILFVIFSLVSSYMERRKRNREVELARQSQKQRAKRQDQELDEGLNEEWLPDLDPFSDRKTVPDLVTHPKTETQLQELESEAEESERRSSEIERRLVAAESSIQDKKLLSSEAAYKDATELDSQVFSSGLKRSASYLPKNPYKIDARRAREALVFAEIIGPPVSERDK
jgi:hypothetical protein